MSETQPKIATTEGVCRYPEIDRRSGLSVPAFKREYQSRRKPVVLIDAVEDWKARTAWTFDFFQSRYGHNDLQVYRYRGEKYKQSDATRMRLSDYINGVASGDWTTFPYYIRDNWALLANNSDLASDYSIPKYFFDWFQLLPPFMRLRYPRIFIGPKGSITPLHLDIWGTHAWLTQLIGRKRWILFPPDQRRYLYDFKVDPNQPDYERFPLFRHAKGVECVIGPGETVFVPANWAHWVESLDSSISLSSNYMGTGAFWQPMTNATRELVLKRAWNSFTQMFHRRDAQARTAQ